MRLSRDFYRPTDITPEVIASVPGSEVYRYDSSGMPAAKVFGGKRSKPDFSFRFHSEERREQKIHEWINNQVDRAASAKARRTSRYSEPHGLSVGSVLYTSWGYDQTNIDYYKVIETKGKTMVKIVPIGSKTVRSDFGADYVVADPDCLRDWDVLIRVDHNDQDKGVWKRARKNGIISLCSHANAYPDSGRERYETAAGLGH